MANEKVYGRIREKVKSSPRQLLRKITISQLEILPSSQKHEAHETMKTFRFSLADLYSVKRYSVESHFITVLFSIFSEIFGVQLESWNHIRNWDSLINNLTSPTDGQSYIQTLNLPRGQRLENIGRRMRTYFLAPETGTYRFYITCDDKCQLNLSTDEKLGNVVTLVTVNRWTRYKQWTRYAIQLHFVKCQIVTHLWKLSFT